MRKRKKREGWDEVFIGFFLPGDPSLLPPTRLLVPIRSGSRLMSSRGREEQDSTGGCKLVEILQHTCPFEEVDGVHRYVCYPIPRIFKVYVARSMTPGIAVMANLLAISDVRENQPSN